MKYIKFFKEITARDISYVGGKGANLGELTSAGFPVPLGFCITTRAYEDFIKDSHVQSRIKAAISTLENNTPAGLLDQTVGEVRSLIEQARIPHDLAEEIHCAYQTLKQDELFREKLFVPVAVRSSATAEDSPDASFAGQHETYLNVRDLDGLLESVKMCWSSLWMPQAIRYRLTRGIDIKSVSMAVVVQTMVFPEVSGVMFTADPISGNENNIIINSSLGLGEAIVSGLVTPDRYDIDKANLTVRNKVVAVKEKMVMRSEAGVVETAVPRDKKSIASLTLAQAKAVAELGKKIESHYSKAQDIEWALADERIYILQARPITTKPIDPVPETRWETPIPNSVYARISITDSWLPEPLSPLFATTFLPALIEGWIGTVNARLVRPILPQAPTCTINGYAYIRADWPLARHPWTTFRAFLDLLKDYFILAEKKWRKEIHPRHIEKIEAFKKIELSKSSNQDILRMTADIQYLSAQYWSMIAALAWYWNISEWILAKLYSMIDTEKGKGTSSNHAILLQGIHTKTAEAENELYDLALLAIHNEDIKTAMETGNLFNVYSLSTEDSVVRDFQQKLNDYLQKYGHQLYSLDFVNPTSGEDPSSVLLALKDYVKGVAQNPRSRQATLAKQREEIIARTLSGLRRAPLRCKLFQKVLGSAQRYVLLRDEILFYFTFGWPLIRQCYLELGLRLVNAGLLDKKEDIFFLEDKELKSSLEDVEEGRHVKDWREEVSVRRGLLEKQKRLIPPHVVPERTRHSFLFSIASLGRTSRKAGEAELLGSAVSPGVVTAPARVIISTEDFTKLKPGDILVAPYTTPAWTPLFASASGLVTDTGGALSHGSIVAREYNIPAVMGTQAATKKIKDGQILTVDGYKGIVYLK